MSFPQSLSNLYFWLDAQDTSTFTLDGNLSVTTILDKASNITITPQGNIINTFLANEINNYQTLVLNNYTYNNVYLQANLNSITTGSAFLVFKSIPSGNVATTNQNDAMFTWGGTQFTFGYITKANTAVGPSTSTVTKTNSPYSATTYRNNYIVYCDWTQGGSNVALSLSINGANVTTGTGPLISGTSSRLYIGYDPSTRNTPVALGELIIYNRVVTSSERSDMFTFLSDKWDVTLSSGTTTTSVSLVLGSETDFLGTINTNYLTGYFDELQISNVSRYTANSVTLNSSAFDKTSNDIILINFDGTANSYAIANTEVTTTVSSNVNYAITNYSDYNYYWASQEATINTLTFKFGTGSLYLNSNYAVFVNYQSLSALPYTIEAWYNISSYGTIFGGYYNSNYYNLLQLSSTSTTVSFPGMSSSLITNNFPLLNVWTHVALVCSTNQIKLFINGCNINTYSGNYTTSLLAVLLGVGGTGTSTLTNPSVVGYIDEFRFSSSARYSSNFTTATVAFVYDSNTLTLNHFNGTSGATNFNLTVDSTSTGTNTITTNANNSYLYTNHGSTMSTSFYKFGTASLYVNSNFNVVTFATNVSSTFTLDLWYYLSSLTNSSSPLLGTYYNSNYYSIISFSNTTTTINFPTMTSAIQIINFPQTLIWTHIAIVGDGSSLNVYVAGSLVGTFTGSYTVPNQFMFGSGGSTISQTTTITAYIDEFRISDTTRYTSPFRVPTIAYVFDANTVCLNHFNGTNGSTDISLTDDKSSSGTNSITTLGSNYIFYYSSSGASVSTSEYMFGSGSLYVNQNSATLYLSSLTYPFTIEFWYNISTIGNLLGYYTSGVYNTLIQITSTSTILSIPGSSSFTLTNYPQFNTWQHVAIVGTSSGYKFFINGTLVKSYTGSYTIPTIYILGGGGIGSSSLVTNITGYIDELRISNKQRYIDSFNLPQSSFTKDSNTITLNHFNGASGSVNLMSLEDFTTETEVSPSYTDNTSNVLYTPSTATTLSTSTYIFGSSALFLNASTCVVNFISTISSNFTIELYYNYSIVGCILSYITSTNVSGNLITISSSSTSIQFPGMTSSLTIYDIPQVGVWTHIAITGTGSRFNVYVDGIYFSTYIGSFTMPNTLILGDSGFVGFIDEFRVSNSLRYTYNFEPKVLFYDSNTLTLNHFNDSSIQSSVDLTTGTNTVTAVSNTETYVYKTSDTGASISTSRSKFGTSSFYITTGYFTLTNLSLSSNFTIELWFYPTSYGSLLSTYYSGSYMNIVSLSTTFIRINLPGASEYNIYCLPPLNKWSNLAIVYTPRYYSIASRSYVSANISVFYNGYYIGYTETTVSTITNLIFGIGSGTSTTSSSLSTSNKFNGYIDELHISNTSRYTQSFTVPSESFFRDSRTIILNHFEALDGVTDLDTTEDSTLVSGANSVTTLSSTITYTYISLGNVTLNTKIATINVASVYCNDSYIYFVNRTAFNTSFTIEFYFYYTTAGTVLGFLNQLDYNNIVKFTSSTVTFSWLGLTPNTVTSTITSKTWHHLAVCGTSNQLKLYIDGSLVSTLDGTYSNVNNVILGAGGSGTSTVNTSFVGYITEFRISSTVRYTDTFTLKPVPFTYDSYTLTLNHFNGRKNTTNFNLTVTTSYSKNAFSELVCNYYVDPMATINGNGTINNPSNSLDNILALAEDGDLIKIERQNVTTYVKVLLAASAGAVSYTLTYTTLTLVNGKPGYTYALGIQDSSQFASNVAYNSRFFIRVLSEAKNIESDFATDSLQLRLLIKNLNSTQTSLVIQMLNETSNVYEELGSASSTETSQEYSYSLTSNSHYQVLNSSTNVTGIGGGDPHFSPIFGHHYTLCNDVVTYRLFEASIENRHLSERIFINGKTWKIPEYRIRRSKQENKRYLYNYTFLKYVSIIYIKNGVKQTIIIDMDTLQLCKYTNDDDEKNVRLPYLDESLVEYPGFIFDNITTSQKKLYKIPINVFLENNTLTLDRNIYFKTIKFGKIHVEFISDPTDELDKNHIKLSLERDCTPDNCFGLLVKEGQIKVLKNVIEE